MSYLELPAAELPDCSKMIISFWFRDISKQQKRPRPRIDWPQGYWTEDNANTVMIPPNAQYTFGGYDPNPKFQNCVDFFNSYGLPLGPSLFGLGELFMGPAAVWLPAPPPLVLNTMELKKEGSFITSSGLFGGNALTMMSEYGVRVLLAFGDPAIDYKYAPWRVETPGVIDAVRYATAGLPAEFLWWDQVPPYTPYFRNVGDNGKFHVRNFRCGEPAVKGKVPPCFIGIDDNGNLFINLQTKTQPTYKGMGFECYDVQNMWFWAAAGKPPPAGFHDHRFVYYGPFWNGYQFKHKDISQKIMGCAPESFVIRRTTFGPVNPMVDDGGWHHVLFSFDLSGSVHVKQDNKEPLGEITTTVSSNCKAWLAFDDKNLTDSELQGQPKVHDGALANTGLAPLLGTVTTDLFKEGPIGTFPRPTALGKNGILPRNAWLKGMRGLPRDGCQWFVANTPRIMDNGFLINLIVGTPNVGAFINIDDIAMKYGGIWGDFNWFFWTNREWMLLDGAAGPNLKAKFDPMHPDPAYDPSKFDPPTYDCSGYVLPLAGKPISIPAGSAKVGLPKSQEKPFSDYNTGIEMAELQIWCNQTLDTSKAELRRLFLRKKKDRDGNDTGPFLPTPPSVAAKTLGKPDVLLHGSGNWKKGKNTGKTGIDSTTGKLKSGGQFHPTKKIEIFKPEPKLGG
jgi:hypothetical protein